MEKVPFAEKEIRTLENADFGIHGSVHGGRPYVSLVDLVEAMEGLADLLGDPPQTGQLRGLSGALRLRFNIPRKGVVK